MTFTITGTLPGLNDYTRANRAHRQAGAAMKRQCEEIVGWAIKAARLTPVTGPVSLAFHWYEPARRRDLDNVAFAKKFILDALVKHGVLEGDGWRHVIGFSDTFSVSDDPRIEVTITPRRTE